MKFHLSDSQKRALDDFCKRHHVVRLAFFGSVLTDAFHEGSDVDVLLEFDPEHVPGWSFFSLPDELEAILGRKVDLTTPGGLHPYIREKVLAQAETISDVS